jgi:uncharacterized protein with GYD domain
MPKYLFQGSYTEEGLKGLLKEGGTKRLEALKQAIESLGGTLEAFYYAFGDNDFYFIADNPDSVNVLAGIILGNASGTVKVKTTVLITAEEVDEAVKKTMDWRPPGQ